MDLSGDASQLITNYFWLWNIFFGFVFPKKDELVEALWNQDFSGFQRIDNAIWNTKEWIRIGEDRVTENFSFQVLYGRRYGDGLKNFFGLHQNNLRNGAQLN